MACRNTTTAETSWRRGCSGVRSIEFTDHLVDDVQQFLAIADVINQWAILRACRVPVHAVHLRIVEAIFHCSPTIIEHLSPFSWTIDADANVEIDPASAT